MPVVIISGIAVDVQRKRIKNLNIRITQDCRVTVSVPLRTSDARIEEFVTSRKDWIEESLTKFRNSSGGADQWYGEGGRISVLGRTYDVIEMKGPKMMCQISDGKVVMTVPDGYSYTDREKYMREWYRSILKGVLPGLFEKWESATGMRCSEFRTRYMKTKWGTCNCRTKVIWMSVRLAEKPIECIDYVVLHELAHTEVPDHGPRFKAILDRHMPDWKERRKLLNYGISPE